MIWPYAVAPMTATMATPSSTILVRCGEAQSARHKMSICGTRRPLADEAGAVPRESDRLADSSPMDRAFILPCLTLTMFAIAGNSLAALARPGGNEVKTQSHAFCRKISIDPLHVRRVCHQYSRTGNPRKARRPEKSRTRIGKCSKMEVARCTVRRRALGLGHSNPDAVSIARFGANTGNSARPLRRKTGRRAYSDRKEIRVDGRTNQSV